MSTGSLDRYVEPHIDGHSKTDGDRFDVLDLSDGEPFASVVGADEADARTAVSTAEQATAGLAETTIPERAAWCESIADGIRDRREELAEVIVREAGKPITSARSEVDAAVTRFERAVEEARRLHGKFRRGTTAGHDGWEAVVKYEPIGTVVCIAPYNYPLATTTLMIAPAIAAGNSVVFKPSSQTPVSGGILTEIIASSEFPDDAFNFIPGRGSVIGTPLAEDDRIDAIVMTGSTSAGKRIAQRAGMVDLHFELGGNAPAVVFEDADLDTAATACTKGSLKYAGQRCSAISRILAHDSIHDELVTKIETTMDGWQPGDLFDPGTKLGPLISEEHAKAVHELVDDAVTRGARLVRGGKRTGRVVEPTLLADVPRDARILHEEQFGPVAPVTRFDDQNEVLEFLNANRYGLDGCVFTADYDRAMEVTDQLEVGCVRINGAPSHGIGDIPFGGVKDSGIGHEGIDLSIERMTRKKTVVL